MIGVVFPPHKHRSHHDNMLVVRVRPSARSVARTLHDPGRRPEPHAAPGLTALQDAEGRGLVKRAASLRRSGRRPRLPGAWARSLSAAATDLASGRAHAGALLVELHERANLADIRAALERDPHVEQVSAVPIRHALGAAPASDRVRPIPFPPTRHWNLERIRWKEARGIKRFRDADDTRVAVLDSGIDRAHPGLKGCIAGYVRAHRDLPTSPSARDLMGHGTHVSGIIAARPRNAIGPQGVCRCRLTMWKVFDDDAPFDPTHNVFLYYVDPVLYRRALAECIERDIEIINLSLGGAAEPDPHEQQLLDALLAKGVTIVAAMGNGRRIGSPTMFPAATPGIIAVGATGTDDTVAPFSSRGRHISLCAPGMSIWSALPRYEGQFGFKAVGAKQGRAAQGPPVRRNTWYDAWPGTSAATPHVAGAAALLRANRPELKGSDVRAQLMRTADRVPGMGGTKFSADYGAGRLNLVRLLTE